MAGYELKDGQGSLFRVKEPKTDRHPTMSGTIKIEGKEYFLDGWTKETREGDKWLSLSAKEKTKRQTLVEPIDHHPKRDDFDPDVPF